MDNPRFLYTNIFDEEFLHIVCRFMFLERVLNKKTTMELMLLKNVVCLSFMDSLHWDAFQGFSTADKMSTIFLKMFSRHWILQCFWQRLQKGGRRLCAEKLSKNKNFKRLLLLGLLDDKGWIRACRNVERITKVNNTLTYYVFYHNVS